jgi:hypothetical protein
MYRPLPAPIRVALVIIGTITTIALEVASLTLKVAYRRRPLDHTAGCTSSPLSLYYIRCTHIHIHKHLHFL